MITPHAPIARRERFEATDVASWRTRLPRLTGNLVRLREFRIDDAPSLFAAVRSEEVSRLLSPPPETIEAHERFIAWTHRERQAGRSLTYAVMLRDSDTPVGLYQVRALDKSFESAEWGFAVASEFWGTGVFIDGARLVLDFAFDVVGVHHLEARAVVKNGRGNGALLKLGAVEAAVLRRSFLRHGEYHDQVLWTIDAADRRERHEVRFAAATH